MSENESHNIAVELTALAKHYSQRGNSAYAYALRSQARQALKGAEGPWAGIIANAKAGLK